tara:strand:- start:22 stop:474 length:453 start_codon:yes stop_codon:yes gene_type:complete
MESFEIVNLKDELRKNIIDSEYLNQIFKLLSYLTYAPTIYYIDFINIIKKLPINHNIYLYKCSNKIVGMITLLIENKLIHGGKCIGHIEDLVVDPEYRSKRIARKLLDYVINICKQENCYKVIINCNESMIGFYNKNNFIKDAINMRYNL